MRDSILGFSQEKLIQYDVDMTDVLLLDYIQKALSQPSMIKIFENRQPYVWLNHSKILEDLPILNIKESMLKKRLSKLISIELIAFVTVANSCGRGSRSYYTITNKFEELQNTTTDKKLSLVEGPQIKNYTSDNQLKNDKNESISKDIDIESEKKFTFGQRKEKLKSKSLFDKCLDLIHAFTDDSILQSLLTEALKQFISNSKENDRPFYSNNFKGKLNQLQKLSDDNYEQRKIVKQTLDKGWNDFYELKSLTRSSKPVSTDMGRQTQRLTKEQKERARKAIEDGTAEKF